MKNAPHCPVSLGWGDFSRRGIPGLAPFPTSSRLPGRCLEALRAVRDWEEWLSTPGCSGDGLGSRTELGTVPTTSTATSSLPAAPCPGQQVLCQALKPSTLKSPAEGPRPIRSESRGWGLSPGEFSNSHWGFLLPTRLNAPAQFLLPGGSCCAQVEELRGLCGWTGGPSREKGREGGRDHPWLSALPLRGPRETWSWSGCRLP